MAVSSTTRTKKAAGPVPEFSSASDGEIPYDEGAEQSALGAGMACEKSLIRLVRTTRPEHFCLPKHSAIFQGMVELVEAGVPVDPITLGHHLEKESRLRDVGGRSYLHGLFDSIHDATRVDAHVAIIKAHYRRRAALRIADAIRADGMDVVEAAAALRELEAEAAVAQAVGGPLFIDWPTFWECDRSQQEWVYEDILARGRGHSIYAPYKEGKSLLSLFIAAQLATGNDSVVVIYLDYEMTEDDLFERLDDMGYGPGTDLSRLRYAPLPFLPPLDTAQGGKALTRLVDEVQAEWPDHHLVVIIDTIDRATEGPENESDTFRDFYRHSGIVLKRRGITWARLDRSGKDPARGPRGASGKGDDVDVLWKLTLSKNVLRLHRDAARMAWVPENVILTMMEEPLRYDRVASAWPEGTSDAAEALDRLGVPLDASVRAADMALREAKQGRRRQVVAAALRWRREPLRSAR